MARKKGLNVYNTDRTFNINLTTKQEESKFVKVTRLNEKEIEREMDKLKEESARFSKRNDKTYLLFKQRYPNDTLHSKIFNHGGSIKYYSDGRVPIPVINQLAGVPQSEVIYRCKKDYTAEDVMNVHLASMATSVVVDVPIVLPDINIYDYLFSLHPLRYHVDKVRISFPALREDEIQERHKKYYIFYNGMYHLKAKYKYQCFCHLQEPLSTWKMNIWLVCDSKKDKQMIEDMVLNDNKRFRRMESPFTVEGE
ncbi:hypothetical protein BCP78_0165 [Bacillus phage BCP78]|uniref:Uncharacterized protein n=3 Tax=Tsarbombavirus BCP78 TaxID=1985182 RepID=J9PRD5_9CAUD|nr:hypothetical protein BCP78_0165 [Bacillus phage BCP78]YP_009783528.1 hypothetical protein QLX27_gp155 [Bacillus phage BCU4]AEW47172.1 hypothetical protein BCP78_0165 [Bacillus phage BCP78]AEW47661.1 hypothetical protein BCU4_0155 [Bacillus phage BCU4]AQN32540.1 hypothetical protein BCP12_128 [Bacillus phage BCP12]